MIFTGGETVFTRRIGLVNAGETRFRQTRKPPPPKWWPCRGPEPGGHSRG